MATSGGNHQDRDRRTGTSCRACGRLAPPPWGQGVVRGGWETAISSSPADDFQPEQQSERSDHAPSAAERIPLPRRATPPHRAPAPTRAPPARPTAGSGSHPVGSRPGARWTRWPDAARCGTAGGSAGTWAAAAA